MSAEQLHELQPLQAVAQRTLQQVADQYGWQPPWNLQEESTALLALLQLQPASLESLLKRMAINRYCACWYTACCSENPFEQHKAFHALYAYLFRTARYLALTHYQLSGDYAEQVATESAQTALITIWQKLGEVRDPGRFLGYGKQIVVREVLHNLQQAGRLESLDREDAPERAAVAPAPESNSEEAPVEKPSPIEEAIRRCLRSKEQQQVVIENFLRNKTLQQIADLLRKKSGAIRVLKHRALEGLRKCGEMRTLMNEQSKPVRDTTSRSAAEPVRYLFQAIEQKQDTDISCTIAESWLSDFVEDEVAGVDVVAKYPDLKRHLDICPECERVYSDLIELTLAENADALPLVSIPEPNLSFLPPLPSFVTLARGLVSQIAQQALSVLTPAALANLPALNELFFQRVEALGGRLPAYRAPAALSPGGDPTTAALITLSAAYLTTQQIAMTFSAQALRAQMGQATFSSTLQQTAARIAQENGMDAADAQTFAQVYAAYPQRNPAAWLTLIERLG